MAPSQYLLMFVTGLGLLVGGARSRSCDVPLSSYNLTTLHPHLQNLASFSTGTTGQQVIVPAMRFDRAGYVTGWSAHTLILTKPNFLEVLTHTITLQVWRPDPSRTSYTLVGSNTLRFAGGTLRDSVVRIPGRTDEAYFSFTADVPLDEQIHFFAGDVVGWFSPTQHSLNSKPLRVLFTDHSVEDRCLVDMHVEFRNSESCAVCDVLDDDAAGGDEREGEADNIVITSVLPFISVDYATYTLHQSCEPSTCEASPRSEVMPMSTTTPTAPTGEIRRRGAGQEQWLDGTATSAIHLLTAATVLVIFAIQVIFCGYVVIKFKKLNKLLSYQFPPTGRTQSCDYKLQSCDQRVRSLEKFRDIDLPGGSVETKQCYLVTPRYSLESDTL